LNLLLSNRIANSRQIVI